jgi:hypothetical protein
VGRFEYDFDFDGVRETALLALWRAAERVDVRSAEPVLLRLVLAEREDSWVLVAAEDGLGVRLANCGDRE